MSLTVVPVRLAQTLLGFAHGELPHCDAFGRHRRYWHRVNHVARLLSNLEVTSFHFLFALVVVATICHVHAVVLVLEIDLLSGVLEVVYTKYNGLILAKRTRAAHAEVRTLGEALDGAALILVNDLRLELVKDGRVKVISDGAAQEVWSRNRARGCLRKNC